MNENDKEYLPTTITDHLIHRKITQAEVHQLARYQGFWREPVNLGEKIALIHSECSKLLEILRDPKEDRYEARAEECADIAIRVMDLCEYLKVDLDEAIYKKHGKNKGRSFRHGKRF